MRLITISPDSYQVPHRIFVEIGKKKAFAGAIDWPGWCRIGRDEGAALLALLDYGPRYAGVLAATPLGFHPPADLSALAVVERLAGTSTTDFGAPDAAPAADAQPVDAAELERLQAILQACWQAFDRAAQAAAGKELAKGPRGGGREPEEIVRHVLSADAAYLGRIAWKFKVDEVSDWAAELSRCRQAILEGLAAAARGELPTHGPRGGVFWTPRYFVRRVAWHVLDHAWEIEDRLS
jgi:hypothetical protein